MTGPFRIFPMDIEEEVMAVPVPVPVPVPFPAPAALLPLNNPLPVLPAGLGPNIPHIIIPPLDFANLLRPFEEGEDAVEAPNNRPGFQYLNDNNGLDVVYRFHNEFQDAVRLQGYNNLDAFFNDIDINQETTIQTEGGTVFNIHYEYVHRSDNDGYHVSSPDFHGNGYYFRMY